MKILVLGGNGFIGRHLVNALLAQGHFVKSFDRPTASANTSATPMHPNLTLISGDFCSPEDIETALAGCNLCFHLISTTLPSTSNADPAYDVQSNVVGTIHLLNTAVKLGIKKIIFISSGGTVYGTPKRVPLDEGHPTNPTCSYGITKLAIEKYIDLYRTLYGLDYCIVRLANPYGEGQNTKANQGAIAVFAGKILRDEPIEVWGDGSVIRDYIYIADVIDALLLAAFSQDPNTILNIGSGKGLSLKDLLREIQDVFGKKAAVRFLPSRSFDVPANILDIQKAKAQLGWEPKVDLREGLKRFHSWLRISS